MVGLSDAYENMILDVVADDITHLSLHFADPGDSGANELVNTAGSIYARVASPGFTSAVNGEAFLLVRVDFTRLPAGPIPFLGYWNDDVFVASSRSGYWGIMTISGTLRVGTDTKIT